MRRLVISFGGLVLVAIAAFILSMRMKFRPVQDAIRRMNKSVVNPKNLKTAGDPGASASLIRHVGRQSGADYGTPVGAVETESGFVIALPYGTNADWLKNVLAAGSAVIVHEGQTCRVDQPELVSAEMGNPYFSPSTQFSHRIFGVDEFLSLRRAETAQAVRDGS